MAKSKQQKADELKKLESQLASASSLIFAAPQGLTVKEVTELRRSLRDGQVRMTVAKRTLLKKAIAGSPYAYVELDTFAGGVAIVSSPDDEVAPAKLLAEFAKTHPALALIGGAIQGRTLMAADVTALAKLPSRDELRAQVVGVIASPLRGFVSVLAGPLRGFVTALAAIRDQKSNA